MAKCEVCGKAPSFGHNVSHAKNRTNRMWRPNIQKMTVVQNGVSIQIKACTRCMRTMSRTR
jgi:large subunit ribosomal protein L28